MVKEKLITRTMKTSDVVATVVTTAEDGTRHVEDISITLPGGCSNEKKTREVIKGMISPDQMLVDYYVLSIQEEKRAITESTFLEMSFVVE